ncbi:ATP-dependent helicase HrpB [Paenibacillus marinisediminis]
MDEVCPSVADALAAKGGAVLVAEPGAGKTTRVPLTLLDAPWLAGQRIVMLEPRRLAARAAAQVMAAALGERVGGTIGYRVRQDTKVSRETRIEVVTEGVLTRMLQDDPSLEGIGLVIFDEFHERNLHADLGLALALEAQAVLREDLRLLVMSATLDAEPVAELMGGVPVITSTGRTYPVETYYTPKLASEPLEAAVAKQVIAALQSEEGDLMVFLPGAGEIRRVEGELRRHEVKRDASGLEVRVLPLYGQLAQEAQDAAIAPGREGERKVVLTTSIAETSLTVQGVRVIIDSGLMRVSRFSPRTGMTRLVTERVTRDAADQRHGRAGRLGPGVCFRLWSETEHGSLAEHRTPEIADADLAPLALELAAWGAQDASQLSWLTPPPAAALEQARALLQKLDALDGAGSLTDHGCRMARLGLHPRLAHMLLAAAGFGMREDACSLAALLQERDLFRSGVDGHSEPSPDIRERLEAVRQHSNVLDMPHIDRGTFHRVQEETRRLTRVIQEASSLDHTQTAAPSSLTPDEERAGLLLAMAYPDRIGERRADGRYLLSNGRGAAFAPHAARHQIAYSPYIVATELDDQGTDSRIRLATPISLSVLRSALAGQIQQVEAVAWDRGAEAVRAREQIRLGALVLQERTCASPDPDAVLTALLAGIAAHPDGIGMLAWTKAARQMQARLQFMHVHRPEEWPDVSDAALTATADEWLAPHLYGLRSKADLQKLQVASLLEGLLPWAQRQQLDGDAPSHLVVPSGSRIGIDYTNPEQPMLAVRLQELFGMRDTPRIAGGRVPLTIQLLSPAHRPVQVTQDLDNFWRHTYFEVKKDLKGRYPKHYWPEDPTEAVATRRVRPPGTSN